MNDPIRKLSELLDVNQAARILSMSTSWIYKAAEAGTIPSLKIGKKALRFRRRDLELYVEARVTPRKEGA